LPKFGRDLQQIYKGEVQALQAYRQWQHMGTGVLLGLLLQQLLLGFQLLHRLQLQHAHLGLLLSQIFSRRLSQNTL
jgi:hypothetical protein